MPTRDLTHPLSAATWTYPGDPTVAIEPHTTIEAEGYRVSSVSMGTHAGTHLDAPSHTEPDGVTIADLPVSAFEFAAAVCRLDVDPGEAIGPDVLPALPDGTDCLVLDTGWAAHWGTDRYVEHPYLSPAAAGWCADRGVSVAIDAPSVDRAGSAASEGGLASHHALLGAGCLVVENLTGLEGLPDRIELRAYPLRLAGGDGSPVRAVAAY